MRVKQKERTSDALREQALERIYNARTLDEITAAWQARADYLRQHPDDWEMLEIGAMLSRLEEALRTAEKEQSPPADDDAREMPQPLPTARAG